MPGHRKRRQFKQTVAFTRGMVIGLKRAGWSIRQIAADTHLGASTVHRLWRRWLEQGNVAIYRNVDATRVTSARVDRRILRQAVAAPQATCTAILQHVQDTLDHSISTRTISRRLVANGLHSCRPLRRLPLTPPNRRQRLEWCRARSTWMTEWHRVVFSDESRFCLSSESRRVRAWRRRGERSNPAAIVERPTVRQRGIMVWDAIAYDSRSPLLRIQGTMTAQRYVDDVLRPVTLPYLQGVPNTLYQQDNARPHTARISQQALQDVQMLPWPPYSPDLSPIEHVWDIIGRRLHALPQPRSEDELWQMVEREWRAIPQDAIRTLTLYLDTYQVLMKKISQLKEDIHRSHLKISLAIVLVLKTDDAERWRRYGGMFCEEDISSEDLLKRTPGVSDANIPPSSDK
ncbi:Transposase [Cordylochernes scorpioides]|uniref:Transposase n=1 Tax=Cordylochernes scorpioides TaxID=51811 RepID=A0ABY6KD31_9ARAC|nr:Transposase [Cordylochernes scorpioides]